MSEWDRPSRFLTHDESVLLFQHITALAPSSNHNWDEGLDAGMVPWLMEVAGVSGVMPIASCEGHPRGNSKNLAMLMLRFDERLAGRIRDTVHELVLEAPYDLHVDYYWMRGDNGIMSEHVTLTWEGLGHHHSLGPVMGVVLNWLKEITDRY
jgi:hypothetical protein